jgi:hypothetical protein
MCKDEPDVLVCARKGSPLIIGVGKEEYVVASDASAIVEHTTQVIYLNDNEMAVLRPNSFRTTTIDDIASRLSTLRAEAWVDAPKDPTPVLSVVATFDGTKEERVSIVQAGGLTYALRDDEPGAARLTAAAVTDVLSLLDPSKATAAPAAPAPPATPPVTRP